MKTGPFNRQGGPKPSQHTLAQTDRPSDVAASSSDQTAVPELNKAAASRFDKTTASSRHDGTQRAKYAAKNRSRSQCISVHLSTKIVEKGSKTWLPAPERPSKTRDGQLMLQDLINHLEGENAKLRQCSRNQVINRREQGITLHAQRESQVESELGERAAGRRAAARNPEWALHEAKDPGNVPRKRP